MPGVYSSYDRKNGRVNLRDVWHVYMRNKPQEKADPFLIPNYRGLL